MDTIKKNRRIKKKIQSRKKNEEMQMLQYFTFLKEIEKKEATEFKISMR